LKEYFERKELEAISFAGLKRGERDRALLAGICGGGMSDMKEKEGKETDPWEGTEQR